MRSRRATSSSVSFAYLRLGRDSKQEKSITHFELEKALELDRPRWMLAHSSVVKMRSLVRHVFYDKNGVRNKIAFKELKGEFDDPGSSRCMISLLTRITRNPGHSGPTLGLRVPLRFRGA